MNGAAIFDSAFRLAEAGRPATFSIRNVAGAIHVFDPSAWCCDHLPGDEALLSLCTAATVDVGCGPGRLTGALARAGVPALGIDVSAAAVRLARRRGATALRRDVFGPLPGAGRWRHLLLADGNIGIGGDPGRLLRRCGDLIAPEGRVHVELTPPGTVSWAGIATVHSATGTGEQALPWASVAVGDLEPLARCGGMRVLDIRTEAARWFATLVRR